MCRWYDLPIEVYPCCDSRSRRYGKKRGWSTHRHSKCASLVCTTIVDSHASIQSSKNIPGKVKAHEARAVATSVQLFNKVDLQAVMKAGRWSSGGIFTSFYL